MCLLRSGKETYSRLLLHLSSFLTECMWALATGTLLQFKSKHETKHQHHVLHHYDWKCRYKLWCCPSDYQPRQWIMSAITLTGCQGCDKENRSLYEPLSLQNLLMSVLLDGLQIRYQLFQCSLSCHPKNIERETLIGLPCEGYFI